MQENIKINLNGKEIQGKKGNTLLQALSLHYTNINSYCGGKGTCGKCKVIVKNSSKIPTPEENKLLTENELRAGIRLACKMILQEDVTIQTIESNWINQEKINAQTIDLLKKAVSINSKPMYGIALDIGTTSVEGWLIRLDTGDVVATHSILNPQQPFGADVISRIQAADTNEGQKTLHLKIIDGINQIISTLTNKENIPNDKIDKMVVVGNPTMLHLFLNISPTQMGRSPYEPEFYDSQVRTSSELNIGISQDGQVITLPIVSGYLGADILGVALALKLDERKENSLIIDIGTNSEILLAGKGRILACSAAAGPAFEGAHIHHGMRASTGAIDQVKISHQVEYHTINERSPIGICGSGLIDTIAELLREEIIEESGRLIEPLASHYLSKHVKKEGSSIKFIFNPDDNEQIELNQKDIREVQLAKGATYAGIKTLMEELNINNDEIEQVYLAGTFGNYINIPNAIRMSIIPDVPVKKVQSVGNAAIIGAALALLSQGYLKRVIQIQELIDPIELISCSKFNDYFMEGINF